MSPLWVASLAKCLNSWRCRHDSPGFWYPLMLLIHINPRAAKVLSRWHPLTWIWSQGVHPLQPCPWSMGSANHGHSRLLFGMIWSLLQWAARYLWHESTGSFHEQSLGTVSKSGFSFMVPCQSGLVAGKLGSLEVVGWSWKQWGPSTLKGETPQEHLSSCAFDFKSAPWQRCG